MLWPQEPHPVRLSQEEVEKRRAQQDSSPLNMFEHLSDLKSFFVEVFPIPSLNQNASIVFLWVNITPTQGISDNVPLVKAVVPKNQSHSFITQGSPDTMVSTDTSKSHIK